jgi:hypothetical protein
MVASGPFALGPAFSGKSSAKSSRLSTPHSSFASPFAGSPASTPSSSKIGGSSIKLEDAPVSLQNSPPADDLYSIEDGVEILDMNNVHRLPGMAPDTLSSTMPDVKKEPVNGGCVLQPCDDALRDFSSSDMPMVPPVIHSWKSAD